MSINTISRIVGSVIAIGTVVGILLFDRVALDEHKISLEWGIAIGVAIIIVAFIITPDISVYPLYRGCVTRSAETAASDLVAAAIGLTIGLIISALLAIPLANLPATWGHLLPFVGAVLFGYLGVTIAVIRKNYIAHLFQGALMRRTRTAMKNARRVKDESVTMSTKTMTMPGLPDSIQILLDTSSNHRRTIADISQTGFIFGTLVVPRFVLNELQRIADSAILCAAIADDVMTPDRRRPGFAAVHPPHPTRMPGSV